MSNRLPQDWIDILTRKLYKTDSGLSTLIYLQQSQLTLFQLSILTLLGGREPKTWTDFNEDMIYWKGLEGFVRSGLLWRSDLPPKPDPANYPNTPSDYN